MRMQRTIEIELKAYMLDKINDAVITDENVRGWYFHDFSEGCYIKGHKCAEDWLKKHNVSAFEALATVIDWERQIFGEVTLKPDEINDAEYIVNLYVYLLGAELLSVIAAESIAELREALND